MSLTAQETATYEQMWALGSYGDTSPGEQFLPLFLDMSRTTMRGSILDAGCGSGKGALALAAAGFAVQMCDLTASGLLPEARRLPFTETVLWANLKREIGFTDWVYCTDVLEHVPTAFTMLAVSRMLEVCRRGAFLSIYLLPDRFGAWVGKPLHQTVQSFTWWRDALKELGTVQECRDLVSTGVYLVTPR